VPLYQWEGGLDVRIAVLRRSRRDLVGKVFFSHYEPRLRDNEHRALADKPLRGGPVLQAIAAH